MLRAQLLRVVSPKRIVVSLESTHAVVELQLSDALDPSVLAVARSTVSPDKPGSIMVQPGIYRDGSFHDSGHRDPETQAPVQRPRTSYQKKRAKPAGAAAGRDA